MEVPREELDPPYDIKLVLCSKLHFFLAKKSTKKLLPPELHFLTPICTKSFVGWALPQTPLGELTALPQTPRCIMGHIYKEERGGKRREERRGRGEEERLGSEFVLCPRKKKRKVGGCVSKHIISRDGGVREIDTGLGQEFYAYTDPYTCNRYGQNVTTLC